MYWTTSELYEVSYGFLLILGVPVNEYTCMKLAETAGAIIPKSELLTAKAAELHVGNRLHSFLTFL